MLRDHDVAATIAVKDIEMAREFYEEKLGLKPASTEEQASGVLMYRTGSSMLMVYQSQFAGTNRATVATWGVGEDLESIAQELKAKGVAFQHYDFPGMTRQGDVHVMGEIQTAWFEDPDGNILSIVNQTIGS